HEDGIRHLRLFNVSQVDHLQYGQSIPEPSVAGLLLLSLLGLWKRKRASPLGRCEPCDSLQPY
ncbi:MAG: PEP-CTERM sorting domain-containing protein, partial [Akkermansiaceae bacterium]